MSNTLTHILMYMGRNFDIAEVQVPPLCALPAMSNLGMNFSFGRECIKLIIMYKVVIRYPLFSCSAIPSRGTLTPTVRVVNPLNLVCQLTATTY